MSVELVCNAVLDPTVRLHLVGDLHLPANTLSRAEVASFFFSALVSKLSRAIYSRRCDHPHTCPYTHTQTRAAECRTTTTNECGDPLLCLPRIHLHGRRTMTQKQSSRLISFHHSTTMHNLPSLQGAPQHAHAHAHARTPCERWGISVRQCCAHFCLFSACFLPCMHGTLRALSRMCRLTASFQHSICMHHMLVDSVP